MSHYLLLIHGNAKTEPSPEEWESFFQAAQESGLFRGGSEIGTREILGENRDATLSDHLAGYMRFDAGDKQQLLDLLQTHPHVVHGGTIELCHLPES